MLLWESCRRGVESRGKPLSQKTHCKSNEGAWGPVEYWPTSVIYRAARLGDAIPFADLVHKHTANNTHTYVFENLADAHHFNTWEGIYYINSFRTHPQH